MIELKPPTYIDIPQESFKIFLAGSIEMDKAEEWQRKIIDAIKDTPCAKELVIFNPRRDKWDNSWKQSMEDINFATQVNWELDHLLTADLILMYLQPGTVSPISLLEYGLAAQGKLMYVLCPEGFHRKGNIDVTSHYFSIPLVKNMDELIEITKNLIKQIKL